MFEQVSSDRSFFAFLIQQLGVGVAAVIWSLITTESIADWVLRGYLSHLPEAAIIVVLGSVPAFFCGKLVQSVFPRFAEEGAWIWLAPSLLLAFTLTVFAFKSALLQNIAELLYPGSTDPGANAEAWWAVWLFTYPTLSCIGYSVGIWVNQKRRLNNDDRI
jgi:hypothetical protein